MKTHLSSMPERSAFTLVELLLVITIIAILASLGVGVMAQAQQDAAISATRSRASLIQKLLEVELENYEVRRTPASFGALSFLVQNASALEQDRLLLHVKLLKRMLIADLIRTEMPDGSFTGLEGDGVDDIGVFPSTALREFWRTQMGITTLNFPDSSSGQFPAVSAWNAWARSRPDTPNGPLGEISWPPIKDSSPRDEIIEDATIRSEMLYQILSRIDVDGVPATETLGPQAIADTDGNGFNEIIDGWGEPMFLQWQQEFLQVVSPEDGTWQKVNERADMCGLSCEHFFPENGITVANYVAPVLPGQIRPFLTSERLFAIDGFPQDFNLRVIQQ